MVHFLCPNLQIHRAEMAKDPHHTLCTPGQLHLLETIFTFKSYFNTKNVSPRCYNYTLSTLSNYIDNLRRVFKYKFGIILELRIMEGLLQNVGQLFSNAVQKLLQK